MVDDLSDFYANLKDITETTFPKTCSTCGTTYQNSADFLAKTLTVYGGKSGLKRALDDNDQPIIELYRNCSCGSTLMNFFSDRRDNSEKGNKRREVFARLLLQLEQKGVTRAEGRKEILKLLKGEESELLKSYGLLPRLQKLQN
ncbi:MAG: oxidoreductase [Pseudomonadota bacterium]